MRNTNQTARDTPLVRALASPGIGNGYGIVVFLLLLLLAVAFEALGSLRALAGRRASEPLRVPAEPLKRDASDGS